MHLLKKDENYIPNKCVFYPSVAFQFVEDKDSITQVFSFSCKDVRVYKNSIFLHTNSFINEYETVLKLSLKHFPNSTYFKKLNIKNEENK